MPLVSESWSPSIGPMGPPSGANNFVFKIHDWYVCDTLDDLKALETHYDGITRAAVLRGRDSKFDGLLQGIYFSIPHNRVSEQSASDSWVIVNDGHSAWEKLF